jgi:DNA-binding transcriptional LysR family regulator
VELRHLQHFIAVAEELSFTRAAERVHIVQSALSSSIKSLEDELKAQLLVRSSRQVQLTPAGRAFLERAREAISVIESGCETVADITGLRRGALAIGTVHTLPSFLDLPSLIARYHSENPGIEVRMRQGDALGLIEMLRSGRLDIAFFPLMDSPDDIIIRKVACEDLVVATPQGHPLTASSEVCISELAAYPFVDFEVGWGTRSHVDRAFGVEHIERRTVFGVTDLGTIFDLVSKGLGIALLPETIAGGRENEVAVVKLTKPEICWELVVAYPKTSDGRHLNRAADALLGMMQYY